MMVTDTHPDSVVGAGADVIADAGVWGVETGVWSLGCVSEVSGVRSARSLSSSLSLTWTWTCMWMGQPVADGVGELGGGTWRL